VSGAEADVSWATSTVWKPEDLARVLGGMQDPKPLGPLDAQDPET
jgi:hypothetical protein